MSLIVNAHVNYIHLYFCVFQRIDDLPIHIKGGPIDKVLFGVTMALCVVGIAYSLQTLYVMSVPKKA
jgi:hypothetical protein